MSENGQKEEVDTLLKWVKALILLIRIRKFERSMSAICIQRS